MKSNKQAGQASRLLLVLAVVVLVAVIIVYLVMKMATKPASPPKPSPNGPTVVLPVYEQTIDNIRFIFESSIDRGGVLTASSAVNTQYGSNLKNFVIENTGARFIQITVGAQNMGTVQTQQNTWDIENVVDSEGRNFAPLSGYSITPWIPNPDLCGTVLQPAFDPTPCTKIYEVSKASSGLKIRVESSRNNSQDKKDSFLIDLIVK